MIRDFDVADRTGYVNQYGTSRKVSCSGIWPSRDAELTGKWVQYIFASVRDSLKRLRLDYIDVLQCEWGIFLAANARAG